MKLLDCTKKVLQAVGLWLLGKLKDLWVEKLKDYLREQLEQLAKDAIDEISKLRDSVEYELKREEIYTTIFENIKLPFFLNLKPVRTILKHMLMDEVEKRVSGALEALRKSI